MDVATAWHAYRPISERAPKNTSQEDEGLKKIQTYFQKKIISVDDQG